MACGAEHKPVIACDVKRLAWLHDTIVAKAGAGLPRGGVAQAAFIPLGHGLLQARWNPGFAIVMGLQDGIATSVI